MVVDGRSGSGQAARIFKGARMCLQAVLRSFHYIPLASRRSALGGFSFGE